MIKRKREESIILCNQLHGTMNTNYNVRFIYISIYIGTSDSEYFHVRLYIVLLQMRTCQKGLSEAANLPEKK